MSPDSNAAWTHHHNSKIGWHLRRLVDVETRLLDEFLQVILILEHKDVVAEVSCEFRHTLLNLPVFERDWISRLPETPLAGEEELVVILVQASSQ